MSMPELPSDDNPLAPDAVLGQPIWERLGFLDRRWAYQVLMVLTQRPRRFSELDRVIPGMSRRTMIERLRDLEGAGLVQRVVDSGPPIATTYRLTAAGERLRPTLEALCRWAAEEVSEAS
jgi:DNA-binding HxlR family transcriptional regulator